MYVCMSVCMRACTVHVCLYRESMCVCTYIQAFARFWTYIDTQERTFLRVSVAVYVVRMYVLCMFMYGRLYNRGVAKYRIFLWQTDVISVAVLPSVSKTSSSIRHPASFGFDKSNSTNIDLLLGLSPTPLEICLQQRKHGYRILACRKTNSTNVPTTSDKDL